MCVLNVHSSQILMSESFPQLFFHFVYYIFLMRQNLLVNLSSHFNWIGSPLLLQWFDYRNASPGLDFYMGGGYLDFCAFAASTSFTQLVPCPPIFHQLYTKTSPRKDIAYCTVWRVVSKIKWVNWSALCSYIDTCFPWHVLILNFSLTLFITKDMNYIKKTYLAR